MELYREIRAFTVKSPRRSSAGTPLTQDILGGIREISQGLPISSIETKEDGELILHADLEFSLANWDNAVSFLRSVLSFMKLKRGYLIVRKISGSADSLKTEIEAYKVTKRGVYYTDFSGPADLLEDVMRFSGRNKRLQKMDSMGNIFRPYGDRNFHEGEGE
ncbi:MAG: hypothetical protein WC291_03730 [Thermodesulfovibrionales bacterium]